MWARILVAAAAAATICTVVAATPTSAGTRSARCTFTDVDAQTNLPCISIGKYSSPGGLTADFVSDIPGGAAFQLVGEEAPGQLPTGLNAVIKFADIPAGVYTITETQVPGIDSFPLACDGRFDNDTVTFGPDSFTIDLDPGEYITCDFVNVQHRVEIVKDAQPDDGTDFAFTGPSGPFTLDDAQPDDGDAVGSSQIFGVDRLASLTYTESALTGWQLDGITCDPGLIRDPAQIDDTSITIDVATRSVTILIQDYYARHIVCTFANSRLPTPTTTTTTTIAPTTTVAPTTIAPTTIAPTTTVAPPTPTTVATTVPTGTLPDTGSGNTHTAILAAALMGLGLLTVAATRRSSHVTQR